MTKPTHTPLPWRLRVDGPYLSILDANGEGVIEDWDISEDSTVGIFCDAEKEVDTFERIVHAVNNIEKVTKQRDALLELIKTVVDGEHDLITRGDRSEYHDPKCRVCRIRETIARVEKEK